MKPSVITLSAVAALLLWYGAVQRRHYNTEKRMYDSAVADGRALRDDMRRALSQLNDPETMQFDYNIAQYDSLIDAQNAALAKTTEQLRQMDSAFYEYPANADEHTREMVRYFQDQMMPMPMDMARAILRMRTDTMNMRHMADSLTHCRADIWIDRRKYIDANAARNRKIVDSMMNSL